MQRDVGWWKQWMRHHRLWQTGNPPGQRTTGRSSAVAQSCTLCYPWTFSIRFPQRTGSGQGAQQSRSKDPGASGRERVRQCGVEGSGAAVSKGIAGVGGAEADCGRDCCTWRLVCESDGKRTPSSSVNAAKRHSSQTSAGRRSSCYRRNGGL